MSLLVIVRITYLIISTAAICSEDQHCRDCDSDSGSCLTECDSGYFDLKCKTPCNRKCRNRKCKSLSGGTEVCTEGCVPGYQGERCNIPCDSPRGNCTACVGGCDGGYCQLSSTCVSGCSGYYYGSDCKHCSNRCKTCNGYSGMCEECFPKYFGTNCEYLCAHCRDTCQFGCLHGCIPGFYGAACEKECSTNCGFSPMMKGNKTADTRPVINDTVECNQYSGDCRHECVDGWFGPHCSLQCNVNCRNGRCNDTGDCVDECLSHYFGRNCIPCPDNCINHTCHTSYGTCVHGCTTGFYGQSCNNTCEFCLDGECDQMTGMCFKGCNTTGHKCTPICRNNCTVDDCQSCQDESEMNTTTGLPTGLTAVVIVIVIIACISAIKRRKTKRAQSSIVQHNDEGAQDDIYSVEYQAINRYWLIRDEDIDMACVPPITNQEEHRDRLAMPLLAECFPTEGVDPENNTDATQSSLRDNESYTDMPQNIEDSGATQNSAGDNQSSTHMSQDVADSGATQSSAAGNQSYTDMSQDVADSHCGATQSFAGDNQSYTDMSRDLPDSDPDTSQSTSSDKQTYTHLLRDVFEDYPKTVVSYISPVVD